MSGNQPDGAARCGFVALTGAPNAGKSTLLNAMVGEKIAIVTHKAQTTRTRLRAIAIHEASQLVFIDTPGIFEPRRRLDRAMVRAAWGGVSDADLAVLLVDCARGLDEDVEKAITGLAHAGRQTVLALNKIDLMPRETLLTLTEELHRRADFRATFMISAKTGDGVRDLKAWLAGSLPSGPWLYPEDQIADVPMRVLAAEITREQIYLRYHEEIPYALTVETESWKVLKNGSIRVEQVIYVQRDGQKKIMIGKQGKAIAALGKHVRQMLRSSIGQEVHLFLFVKVREKWGEDPERYAQMGLDYGA